MTDKTRTENPDWQLQHYANVGTAYGKKHFTMAESVYTKWILGQIAATHRTAQELAEVGAGTCVFASLLGKQMAVQSKVVCYEPVQELLAGAAEFDNVEAHCGGAIEFSRDTPDGAFDFIFTKDTAHHFSADTLAEIHNGFCAKLKTGGRYTMVVRTPPDNDIVPVGHIASQKWPSLYTPLDELVAAMRRVDGWKEVALERWEKSVETPVKEWIDGAMNRDTWSVFSALSEHEIAETVHELESRFGEKAEFRFVHQYDVAVYEKK